MSGRRRFKPAVILAPRRAATINNNATTASEHAVDESPPATALSTVANAAQVRDDSPPPNDESPNDHSTIDLLPCGPTATPSDAPPSSNPACSTDNTNAPSSSDVGAMENAPPASTPPESANIETAKPDKPPASGVKRRLKPVVCLPVRNKRKTAPAPGDDEPAPAKQPDDAQPETPADVEAATDAADSTCFKSPPPSSGQTLENVDIAQLADSATAKPQPNSPNKQQQQMPRQRIRPTPHFGHRRNSIQGADSESSDAESSKRQRYMSTSSAHGSASQSSWTHAASLVSAAPANRQRTESLCSTLSESAEPAPAFGSLAASGSAAPSASVASAKPKKSVPRSDVSQRIASAKREFQHRFNGQQPDKARLTMFDMIFYNPVSNPMKNPAPKSVGSRSRRNSNASSLSEAASAARSTISAPAAAASSAAQAAANGTATGAAPLAGRRTSTESNVSMVSRTSSSNGSLGAASLKREQEAGAKDDVMPVPQLKLGPNGEIMLDEKSLVIETTGDKEARETLANAEIIYDDEFSGTTGFYKRNKRTRDWPADETIRFYRCLQTIGTDFSLMLSLFPNRTRRDLKLKFKKEERINADLINKALLHPNRFDVDELKLDFEREHVEAERAKIAWEEQERQKREDRKAYVQNSLTRRRATKSAAERQMIDSDCLFALADAAAARSVVCKPEPKRKRRPRPQTNAVDECNDATNNNTIETSPAVSSDIPVDADPQNEPFCESTVLVEHIDDDSLIDMITSSELDKLPITFRNEAFDVPTKENAPADNNDIMLMEIVLDGSEASVVEPVQSFVRSDDKLQPMEWSTVQPDDYPDASDIETMQTNSVVLCDARPLSKADAIVGPLRKDTDIVAEATTDGQCSREQSATEQSSSSESEDEPTACVKPEPDSQKARSLPRLPNVESSAAANTSDNVRNASAVEDDTAEDDDDDDDDLAGLVDSLVVVARQDTTGKIVHEVFLMSPTTGQLSEEPLDLPADVIERIKATLVAT